MNESSGTILLVEDNDDDVFAIRRALKNARIGNPLQVVTDGQRAVDYLSGADEYGDRARYPLPFITFLDLKLPYIDGFEVLSWIRQRPALESILVVVLTGSAESRDQERAYALGARSYLIKPPTADSLQGIFQSLNSFWLSKASSSPVATESKLRS